MGLSSLTRYKGIRLDAAVAWVIVSTLKTIESKGSTALSSSPLVETDNVPAESPGNILMVSELRV